MRVNTFVYPWRVEVRSTRFHPWSVMGIYKTLDDAVRAERFVLKDQRLSRVRAN